MKCNERDVEKKETMDGLYIRIDDAIALYASASKVLVVDTTNHGGRNYFVSSMHKLKEIITKEPNIPFKAFMLSFEHNVSQLTLFRLSQKLYDQSKVWFQL